MPRITNQAGNSIHTVSICSTAKNYIYWSVADAIACSTYYLMGEFNVPVPLSPIGFELFVILWP